LDLKKKRWKVKLCQTNNYSVSGDFSISNLRFFYGNFSLFYFFLFEKSNFNLFLNQFLEQAQIFRSKKIQKKELFFKSIKDHSSYFQWHICHSRLYRDFKGFASCQTPSVKNLTLG